MQFILVCLPRHRAGQGKKGSGLEVQRGNIQHKPLKQKGNIPLLRRIIEQVWIKSRVVLKLRIQ